MSEKLTEKFSVDNKTKNDDENNENFHHSTSGKVSFAERKLLNKQQFLEMKKLKRPKSVLFPRTPTFFEYKAVNSLTDDESSSCSSEFSLTHDYVRMPGFAHHGHTKLNFEYYSKTTIIEELPVSVPEICDTNNEAYDFNGNVKLKKIKNVKNKNSNKKNNQSKTNSPRAKPKRDPLPMKLRALPQSFWQQPNHTNVLSPGTVYPVLPPLAANSRELTPPEDRPQGIISVANTDLLFSLFREVEAEQRKVQGKYPVSIVKRGRPKKPPTSLSKSVLKDDDPCLVSTVTDTILPLIPIDKTAPNSIQAQIAEGQQVLAMVSLNGEREDVILPNLNADHKNYSQILSDLVIQL